MDHFWTNPGKPMHYGFGAPFGSMALVMLFDFIFVRPTSLMFLGVVLITILFDFEQRCTRRMADRRVKKTLIQNGFENPKKLRRPGFWSTGPTIIRSAEMDYYTADDQEGTDHHFLTSYESHFFGLKMSTLVEEVRKAS